MGVLIACDYPDAADFEEPLQAKNAVRVSVRIDDPETGTTETTAFFCTKHGDEVTAKLGLESLGFTVDE